LDGFRKLFEEVGSRSCLQSTLDDHQFELAKIGIENRRQEKKDTELQDNINLLELQQDKQRKDLIKMQDEVNGKFEKRIEDLEHLTEDHTDKIKNCQHGISSNRSDIDKLIAGI
jgi:disulfide oxidoreductase YuzD